MSKFNSKKIMLIGLKGDKGDIGETGAQGVQGETGAKIVSTVLTGQDANGGNIYTQTFDDGSTATFTAPKGATGAKGNKGDTGNTGATGVGISSVTATSNSSSGLYNTVTVTKTDGSTNTFKVWNGEEGERGKSILYTTETTTSSTNSLVRSNIKYDSGAIAGIKFGDIIISANGDLLYVNSTANSGTNISVLYLSKIQGAPPSVDDLFPIGSIYMRLDPTSPAELFGGTWAQIKDKFLIGAGGNYSLGATGGEATHTLTENEMPEHTHEFRQGNSSSTTSYELPNKQLWTTKSSASAWSSEVLYYGGGLQGVQKTGGGAAHNNMPPYQAVYMWYRVS